MAILSWNRYGKSRIRLVKVRRSEVGHEIVDLTLDVSLEGEFDDVYVAGDNRSCLTTDAMKNTVYAFARQDPILHVEAFALRLAGHFAARPGVSRVRIAAAEQRWHRLSAGGRSHPHAFARGGDEQWTAQVTCDREGTSVASGLTGLVVLKTANSAFAGFLRDEYTTLAETQDRVFATSITATWLYRRGVTAFEGREAIRTALLEAFAGHASRSVQHTLHAMGESALAACADITEITLALPNRHHFLVDLTPFGLDNPNDVFVATDQPFGLIEGTIRRSPP